MKYTNKYGIKSRGLLSALKADNYDAGNLPENVISCTKLIGSPRIAILSSRHRDELEDDVSGRVWSMLGTAVHWVIEQANKSCDERLSEERWVICIDSWAVYTVSSGDDIASQDFYDPQKRYVTGRFDSYDSGTYTLEDYKITSAWSFTFGGKPEWDAQLNINAFALRLLGFVVNRLVIIGILKDHDHRKAGDNYPEIPIVEYPVGVWGESDVKSYVEERYSEYSKSLPLEDNSLPRCTKDERWARGGSYAVMKSGRKSAVKLFSLSEDGKADAEKMAFELNRQGKGKHSVESRPDQDVRCTDHRNFCLVKKWCEYYQTRYGNHAAKEGDW